MEQSSQESSRRDQRGLQGRTETDRDNSDVQTGSRLIYGGTEDPHQASLSLLGGTERCHLQAKAALFTPYKGEACDYTRTRSSVSKRSDAEGAQTRGNAKGYRGIWLEKTKPRVNVGKMPQRTCSKSHTDTHT